MKASKQYDFSAHETHVQCLALGPQSGRVLVTGGADRRIHLWKIGQTDPVISLAGHATCVDSVCLDWPEELLVAGAASGAIKLWDLDSSRVVRTLSGHSKSTCCVEFHPFGDFFASGSVDLTVKIWDIRRRGCIQTYHGHRDKVEMVKITPDGRWLATGSLDSTIHIWDMTAGKLLHTITQHTAPITSITFHPSEFLMATSSADGAVNVFDLQNFECISKLPIPDGFALVTRFSADGTNLFSASSQGLYSCKWEPFDQHQFTSIGWGNIKDFKILPNEEKMVGVTMDQNLVSIWNVELSKPTLSAPPTQDLSNSFSGAFNRFSLQEQPVVTPKQPGSALNTIKQKQEPMEKPKSKKNVYVPMSDGNKPLNLDISKFMTSKASDMSASLPISPVEAGMPDFSDEDLMEMVKFRHTSLMNIFQARLFGIRCVHEAWDEDNLKSAVEVMTRSRDAAVWVDILRILNLRPKLLTLDVAVLLLPVLRDLLFEVFEDYLMIACDTVRILSKSFSEIIMTSLSIKDFSGVDISREERVQKCELCHSRFVEIYNCLKEMKKISGKLGTCIIDTINDLLVFTNE